MVKVVLSSKNFCGFSRIVHLGQFEAMKDLYS